MFNTLEAYAEIGRKAGIARNERDEGRALFQTGHFQRMLALESLADKAHARKAFDDAYRSARNVPQVRDWR